MPDSKFSVTWDQNCQVGVPWKVTFQGVSDLQSIVVDFYGCTGGIYRYFPRGREQMDVWFRPPAAGRANMIVFGRDKVGRTLDGAVCEVDITPASGHASDTAARMEAGNRNHQMAASARASRDDFSPAIERSLGRGATVLPQNGKPPMADTWCPATGPAGYGMSLNAPASVSAQPQRTADLGEALRQQVEARIMKRFDKT